jgi:ATP-dependent DNA helicase RecG
LLIFHQDPENWVPGAFFRSGQIEAWGRGIEKISDSCRSWGKPEPFYEVHSNYVMIGFNTDAGIGENIGENETQRKILNLMLLNPKISAKVMADVIGIAPRNVEANINNLKKAGLVERVGPAKGGHWVVKPPK